MTEHCPGGDGRREKRFLDHPMPKGRHSQSRIHHRMPIGINHSEDKILIASSPTSDTRRAFSGRQNRASPWEHRSTRQRERHATSGTGDNYSNAEKSPARQTYISNSDTNSPPIVALRVLQIPDIGTFSKSWRSRRIFALVNRCRDSFTQTRHRNSRSQLAVPETPRRRVDTDYSGQFACTRDWAWDLPLA